MDETIYLIPTSFHKPVKVVFDDVFVDCNENMSITVKKPATLEDIAELFNMTPNEVLNTRFGVFDLNDLEDN